MRCDHQALRRYCLRNPHATMMDIATWAREYFQKIIVTQHSAAATSRNATRKLYDANRKAFNNFAAEIPPMLSGPESHPEMDRKTVETCSLV